MRPLRGTLLLLLLLLLTCQLVTPTPIFDRDGFQSVHRAAGFGETLRDWFRILKDRIAGKWQEWFGDDDSTPTFSPQTILNIDKTLGSRVQGYPGLFLDLSSISFDQKRDWGVRFGNWYIIRKVTGDNYGPDSDSDEWDIRPLLSKLPLPPILKADWMPNIHCTPEARRPPTTTERPRTDSTTSRRETTQAVTQTSVLTSAGSTVSITEPAVTIVESIAPITQIIATSTEPAVTSTEQIPISDETAVTNGEPIAITTESTLTSTEPITISIESIVTSTEPITISIESIVTSTEPISISAESTASSAESTEISNDSSTDLPLPVFDKRIEDNETVDTRTQRPNNRPSSAEVVMF